MIKRDLTRKKPVRLRRKKQPVKNLKNGTDSRRILLSHSGVGEGDASLPPFYECQQHSSKTPHRLSFAASEKRFLDQLRLKVARWGEGYYVYEEPSVGGLTLAQLEKVLSKDGGDAMILKISAEELVYEFRLVSKRAWTFQAQLREGGDSEL